MDDRRWKIAKRIFSEAVALPPEDRVAWIEKECEDGELRREILELLEAHSDSDRVPAGAERRVAPAEGPGATIGRYKLLQEIGEGGFGVVYMAAQTDPVERRVALKIIKPGMDSEQIIARFEAERQALALMDHPNIASVLDAGATASGQPFFVMELVKGIPITEYCDQHELTTPKRLRLFIRVCQGVQHAHQKGVIHRDLKPSNVLVAEYDNRAVPKIIDFGVAKATSHTLTEKTVFTEFGQLVGTLEYMSPEQAKLNQLDIDTRSDVYSLGVLLYQLLTGTTPFPRERLHSAGFEEMLRIIREEDPPKPSARVSTMATVNAPPSKPHSAHDHHTLSRVLRGDLDWIVMCSMDKERNRRYDSAGSMATDLDRYLRGEPVHACPPSSGYRLRKFVGRHRGAVVAASALLLTLALGLVGTSLGLLQAKESERDAVAARESEHALYLHSETLRESAVAARNSEARKSAELSDALDVARRRSYAAGLTIANFQLAAGNHAEALRYLEVCPEELRGFEWGHLKLWQDPARSVLSGHWAQGSRVEFLALSKDGARMLSAGARSLVLWDNAAGNPAKLWSAPARPRFAMSADRRFFATSAQGKIVVRYVTTGTVAMEAPVAARARLVALTRDGKLVAVSDGRTVQVFATADAKSIAKWDAPGTSSLTFTPDARRVISGSYEKVARIHEVASGKEVTTLDVGDRVIEVRVSPNGHWLLTGVPGRQGSGRSDFSIWDLRSLKREKRGSVWSSGRDYSAVAFRPRHDDMLVNGELWRLKPAASRRLKELVEVPVRCVAWTADGERAILGCGDKSVRVWGSRELTTLGGHKAPVISVAVSGDGTVIASGAGDGEIRLWDVETDRITTLPGPYGQGGSVCQIAFRDGGRQFVNVTMNGTVRVWDATTGDVVSTRWPAQDGWSSRVSADGTRHAIGLRDGTIQVSEVATGKLVATFPSESTSPSMLSRDGRRLVACGRQGVIIWDVDAGRVLARLAFEAGASKAAISADGTRVAAMAHDDSACVWDVASGEIVCSAPASPADAQGHLTGTIGFSPDGRQLVWSRNRRRLRLWDIERRRLIATLSGHADCAHAVAFSPDGLRIATSSSDNTLRIWDGEDGSLLATLDGIRPHSIAFSRDGRRLVASRDWTHGVHVIDSDVATARKLWQAATRRHRVKALLDELFTKHRYVDDIVAALAGIDELDAAERALAKRLAEGRGTSPLRVQADIQRIVARPGRKPDEYEQAFQLIDTARRKIRGWRTPAVLLGAAQYRTGRFDEALKTLRSAPPENRPDGQVLLYTALTHFQLGDVQAAKEELAKAEARIGKSRRQGALLREAKRLILAPPK